MSCPNCGNQRCDGSEPCERCGWRALVCRGCGAPATADHNFCSHCGSALRHHPTPELNSQSASVRAPARLMRSVLESRAALEGERKQVTVLFADLRGWLSGGDNLDPEEARALLGTVLHEMVEAVHRYEGAVSQVIGDGIMALFGAPVAHEDHALRAACAALAMRDAVLRIHDPGWSASGTKPPIHVGLHSGEVVIQSVRNDLSMEYRAIGLTSHIAARIMQVAPAGEIWLSAQTQRLGRGLLRTRSQGPVRVKGVEQPIEMLELAGISVRTRFQANALRGLSPLINNEATLASLGHSLASVAAGSSRAAVLCGEPGVGKSRLCHELLGRAHEHFRVLEAAAVSYGSATTHGVLASMLRSLLGIDDDDDRARLIGKTERCLDELFGDRAGRYRHVALELLDVPSDDREWARLEPIQRRRAIEEMFRALLDAWCALGPAVLLFEDLHWCDPDSLAFISKLVETPPGPHALLLLTHRPELKPTWDKLPHVVTCQVGGLDPEHSEALLVSLLGVDSALASLRSRLVARTDGNPLFIEESVRSVLESGALPELLCAANADAVEVPASIEALLGARIDRLPGDVTELLQAAAVIGDDSPVEVLRRVTGLDPAAFSSRLLALTEADLLYQTDPIGLRAQTPSRAVLRFKHALIWEVVYRRLMRPRRRALHARVLEVLEGYYGERKAEHLERLASHAYRAELWSRSAEYQKRACIRAANRSANAQAIEHLDQGLLALQLAPKTPERELAAIDLRLTALACLLPVGDHERVIMLLREAEQLARELGDVPRQAKVLSQLSAELWVTARYDLGAEAARRALAIASKLGDSRSALAVSASYNLAMIHHARGEYPAAQRILRDRLPLFEGDGAWRRLGWAGYPSVLVRTFLIACAMMTGDFLEAERAWGEGSAIADELGHAFSRAMVMFQYGACLIVQGEAARAAALLREALALVVREEVHTMYVPTASQLGLALLELGAHAEARAILEQAALGRTDLAGHYAIDFLTLGRALADLQHGDLSAAMANTERVLLETEALGERGFHVHALLVQAAVLEADPRTHDEALAVYDRGIEQAGRLGMRPWLALLHQNQARLHEARGERQSASDALDAALLIWQELRAEARIAALRPRRQQLGVLNRQDAEDAK